MPSDGIYMGNRKDAGRRRGDIPVEEEIKNVMALTEKLISDNMSE